MRNMLIAALLLAACGCSKPVSTASDPKGGDKASATGAIDGGNAPAFWREFGDNEITADTKYKGKHVKITGTVKRVASDDGKYFVGLEVIMFIAMTDAQIARLSQQEREWFRSGGYPPNVICYLADSAKAKAASLKEGARATVTGKCVGRKAGGVYKGYVVVLEDCVAEAATK